MIIAREKRKQNIVEYIIYMYQVEDTIRAFSLDMEILEERVISQFSVSEAVSTEIRDWYSNIIVMMHEEGVKESGHISLLNSLVNDLESLHRKILNEVKDSKYIQQYSLAQDNIAEFEKKIGDKSEGEIQICLTGLYALLLLRLQKKNISKETLQAMQSFSNLLAVLGSWFKKLEEGELEI